jgi:ribonuclease HII
MKVLGIDEAGRGAVIGSLWLAGVMLPLEKVGELEKIGVKDSKKLSRKKIQELSIKIREICRKYGKYYIYYATPKFIDESLEEGYTLNDIEKWMCVGIIDKLRPDFVVLDSFDVKPWRLGWIISKNAKKDDYRPLVKAKHRADETETIVAAASILAKEARADENEELRKKYGDFGSGYYSDPKTRNFLLQFKYRIPPGYVVKSYNLGFTKGMLTQYYTRTKQISRENKTVKASDNPGDYPLFVKRVIKVLEHIGQEYWPSYSREYGMGIVTNCIFHENYTKPFLYIHARGFKCFGCEASGDPERFFDLVMEKGDRTFRDGLIRLFSSNKK